MHMLQICVYSMGT